MPALFAAEKGNTPETEAPYLKMIVEELSAIEEKAVSLADAFPDDKFGWRPADGVRSVSEIFVHMCGANYWIPSLMGEQIPESFGKDAEKTITSKADVIKTLKDSYKTAQIFVASLKADDLETTVKTPFGDMSKRKLALLLVNHGHEHIGQGIAYARSNGVVPPWSKKEK